MKVLVNRCYGGFGFSKKFISFLKKNKIKPSTDWEMRDDPAVIAAALEFGIDKISDKYSKLVIEEVPDHCEYIIEEYDGMEWLSRTYFKISPEILKRGLTEREIEIAKKVNFLAVSEDISPVWDQE